jgi:glutaredoxin
MKVRAYTLSYCPWCKKTKKFLADHKVEVDCIDYDLVSEEEQKSILNEMRSKSKEGVAFPFVIIGDEAVVGYNPERYLELLGLKD